MSEPLRIAEAQSRYWAQIPEDLLRDASPALRVYGWLDRRAGARGYWHHSARKIAAAVELDHTTVVRALRLLDEREFIVLMQANRREFCINLVLRIGAPARQLKRGEWCAHAPQVARQRATQANRTFIRSEEPSGSPYRSEDSDRIETIRSVYRRSFP